MSRHKTSTPLVICIWAALLLTAPAQSISVQPGGVLHLEFRVFEWGDAVTRLDNFFPELGNKPDSEWLIIVYGGQNQKHGEAEAWAACVKDHVFNRRGFVFGRYGVSPDQVKVIGGGYREKMSLEFWLVPRGERSPAANPTVRAEDVRFRGRVKNWQSLCKP